MEGDVLNNVIEPLLCGDTGVAVAGIDARFLLLKPNRPFRGENATK